MYITPEEYEEITGRDKEEAIPGRIKIATQLLDARIGPRERDIFTGLKLDLATLPVHQKEAVKTWCAHMIAYLVDNGDKAPTTESLTLGRFSVTQHGQKETLVPEELGFADSILVSSGLINRKVKMT
ncbi:MAG TPA: hypothetical protein PK822_08730 [Bacillota bacterium]|nr:hypothetical protein [Bacillota bacterium]